MLTICKPTLLPCRLGLSTICSPNSATSAAAVGLFAMVKFLPGATCTPMADTVWRVRHLSKQRSLPLASQPAEATPADSSSRCMPPSSPKIPCRVEQTTCRAGSSSVGSASESTVKNCVGYA